MIKYLNRGKNVNKLMKNASWIIGCKIAQSVLSFIVSMITARYLGPSNYGVINYAVSLIVFVTPIMQLGFNNILVQELIDQPKDEGEILGTVLFFSMLSSIICIGSVTIFVLIINKNDVETIGVCIIFSINLIFQALEQIEYWFQAKLLSKYKAIVGLVAYIVVSGYKIYLLMTEKNVYWFAMSYTLDYLIISFSLYILYRRLGGKKLKVSWKKAKEMFSRSHPYILSSMMITIFTQTDKIMLNQMLDSSATGFYSAAVLLAGVTMFVFQAIIDSFRPKLFEDLKSNKKAFENGIIQLYSIVIYLSLAQSLIITIFARLIVFITYGESYLKTVSALRIVSWFTVFSFIGVIRNIWILAEEKQRYLTLINLCGAIANVCLNFMLIPRWGINGAACASLFTQFFTNVGTGLFLVPIRYNNILILKSFNPKIILGIGKKIYFEFARKRE